MAELFKMVQSDGVIDQTLYTRKDCANCNLSWLLSPCIESCCLLEVSSWCPGLVSSQYFTFQV